MTAALAGAMLGSAALGAAAGYFGSKEAAEAQSAAQQAAIAYQAEQVKRAIADLEAVGIPSIEAQQIVLQYPELVGLEKFEALPESQLSQTYADESLTSKQREALAALAERSKTGLTAEELAQRNQLMRSIEAQAQARDASIMQNMAQSGMSGSGQALAMKIAQGQAAVDRGALEAQNLAAERDRRALEAISQMGSLAGSMSAADFGQKKERAMSIDEFNRLNAQQKAAVAQRNLERQQSVANAKIAAANQQELHNKELIQQRYQNELDKARAMANARTGGGVGQSMFNAASGAGAKYAALGQLGVGLGAAGAQAIGQYGQDAQKEKELKLKYNLSDEEYDKL